MRSSILSRCCVRGVALVASGVLACQGGTIDLQGPGGAPGAGETGGASQEGSGGNAGEKPSGTGGRSTAEGGQGGDAGSIDPASLDPLPGVTQTDKVDLLLVLDNSHSMQDKQVLLARSMPRLLAQLANPPCVDDSGNTAVNQPTSPDETCPDPGTMRTHLPVKDLHLGVVTSSLGGHGNDEFCNMEHEDDQGRLINGDLRSDSGASGLVVWDTSDSAEPGLTISDFYELMADAQTLISAVGEDGCGYEATLEAWYRFLADPVPPLMVAMQDTKTVRLGVDEQLLEERRRFLRPDSALLIVILSDENDCSIRDEGYGWLASQTKIDQSTAVCATNPNDRCCTYCGFLEAPEGCPSLESDPGCARPKDDATNVRCWDMKRRFGIDFLYPVTRYVAAIQDRFLCPDSSAGDGDCRCRRARELGQECTPGTPVPNPIYQDLSGEGREVRDPSLVSVVGVVGVPWQDLATDATVDEPEKLRYKTSADLDWDLFLGDPSTRTKPLDTLMVESTTPRSGPAHPITGIAPAPPASDPLANPINGHEWSPVNDEDLQYACIFPLEPVLDDERDCSIIGKQTCDCFDPTNDLATVNARKKPLCQAETGEYGNVQRYAKAYPGLRHLELLHALGSQGHPASICPKVLEGSSPADTDYGYNPALGGVLTKLRRILK
ncbi:MAG: hypothetical protein JW940_04095 [Polyangiaceae bacterium]|nr:hypothetical protein [Polyangiaceae bacterium]